MLYVSHSALIRNWIFAPNQFNRNRSMTTPRIYSILYSRIYINALASKMLCHLDTKRFRMKSYGGMFMVPFYVHFDEIPLYLKEGRYNNCFSGSYRGFVEIS